MSEDDAAIRSNSYLFGGNAPYVEEMYEAYLDNPAPVDNWRAISTPPARSRPPTARTRATWPRARRRILRAACQDQRLRPRPAPANWRRAQAGSRPVADRGLPLARWRAGPTSTLCARSARRFPELEPAFYDLSESDMDISFSATTPTSRPPRHMTLREIVQALRQTYCGDRRRVHARHRADREALVAADAWSRSAANRTSRRAEGAHPRPPDGAEGLERYLQPRSTSARSAFAGRRRASSPRWMRWCRGRRAACRRS